MSADSRSLENTIRTRSREAYRWPPRTSRTAIIPTPPMSAAVTAIAAPVPETPPALRAGGTVEVVARPALFFAVLWLAVALCIVAGDAVHVWAGGRGIGGMDLLFRGAAY